MTKLNQQILDMVKEHHGHLTAQEAFILAKSKNIDVSVASVYRILANLADEGYINRISIPSKADVFDRSCVQHGHMICDKCGKIVDVEFTNLKEILTKQTGVEVNTYDLCIHYVCDSCKKG